MMDDFTTFSSSENLKKLYYNRLINDKLLLKKLEEFGVVMTVEIKKDFSKNLEKKSLASKGQIDFDIYSKYLIELMDLVFSLRIRNLYSPSTSEVLSILKKEENINLIKKVDLRYINENKRYDEIWFNDGCEILYWLAWNIG